MKEIVDFLREYIELEYEATIAYYSEADNNKFIETCCKVWDKSLVAEIGGYERQRYSHKDSDLEEWVNKSKEVLQTIVRRPIYYVERYRHAELGDIFACYVGQMDRTIQKDTICLYAVSVWGKLRIVAVNHIDDRGDRWEKLCSKGIRIPLLELKNPLCVSCFLEPPEEFLKWEYFQSLQLIKPIEELDIKGIFDNNYGFHAGKYFCRIFIYGNWTEMLYNFIEDIYYEGDTEALNKNDIDYKENYKYFNLMAEIEDNLNKTFGNKFYSSSWLLARLWYLSEGMIQKAICLNENGKTASDGGQYNTLLLIEDIEMKEGLGILEICGTPTGASISIQCRSKNLDCRDFYEELSKSIISNPLELATCKLIVEDFEGGMYPFEYGYDDEKFLGWDNSKR